MQQAICGNSGCGGTLLPGYQFCGDCGTPVLNGERGSARPTRDEVPVAGAGGGPFFGHQRRIPARMLSNATRHLCAGAYLNRGFANLIVGELVSSRRAVAPSVDIDLGPIIRHCLRARRNLLIRDLLLIGVIVIGLFISAPSTISFVVIAIALGVLIPKLMRPSRNNGKRHLIALSLVVAFVIVTGLGLLVAVGGLFLAVGSGGTLSSVRSSEIHQTIPFLIVLVLTWAVQYGFILTTLRTLDAHTRQGVEPPSPHVGRVEDRIALVEGAQRGNITLYSGDDPFIGAGFPQSKYWSIAIKLAPATPLRHVTGAVPEADKYVPIDPVALHQSIRQRLLALKDPGLPPNERIAALQVTDRLVGSGALRWDSPLVDPVLKTPYSYASPEAVDTLIRYPQAGLRYFQQVSVNDEGPPVIHDGQLMLNAVDHGVAVTAFLYAAVEGRMFYLQFVLTVLPPVIHEFQGIEHISPGALPAAALRLSLTTMFKAVAYVPAELWGAFKNRLKQPGDPVRGLATGDLGARISARVEGSDEVLNNYLHRLDVEKYNRIFERLILESVEEFLAAEGVDTSAFRSGANTVVNGNVIGHISGGNNMLGGHDNTMNTQAGAPPQQPVHSPR